MNLKSYFCSSVEAGTLGLAFLVDTSAFSSDYNFLFAAVFVKVLGAAEPEGLSVTGLSACLGDLLGEDKTFTGEGLFEGLSRRAG
jgi:hypothetical protein